MTKPKEKPRRSTRASGILVMRGGAIGDFILTLPALAAIRQKWPDSHLDLAAAPSLGQLALTSGLVDKEKGSCPPRVLGDIAISVETAARRRPAGAEAETEQYLIHGLLHLAGYDHGREVDRQRMNRKARWLRGVLKWKGRD